MSKKKDVRQNPRVGRLKQKILLLLLGGLALGLTPSPKRQFRIVKEMVKEWGEINTQALERALISMYVSGLVTTDTDEDSLFVKLTPRGKELAQQYDLHRLRIKKPTRWDGKWRLVLFDIPEGKKRAREALRMHLYELGFREFQKSAFIHPYPCTNQILTITASYNIEAYVQIILAEKIQSEKRLKIYFGI